MGLLVVFPKALHLAYYFSTFTFTTSLKNLTTHPVSEHLYNAYADDHKVVSIDQTAMGNTFSNIALWRSEN